MQQPAVIETVLTGLLDDPEPRWSPDGAELVYVRAVTVPNLKHLAVIDLATRQTVQISRNYGLLTPGSWSPDGSAIAFSAARSDNRIGLFIVDLATGEEQWLNNAFMPKPPNWSPRTGSLIWRGGDGDIYAREGEATRRLVAATGNDAPVWSSDGTQVLYLDDGEFTVMDADGGNRRVIAHPAYEKFNPVWRPVPKG
jgi:Tol biopolymer transport system component